MDQIKGAMLTNLSNTTISCELPQQIVQIQTARPSLPDLAPRSQIVIDRCKRQTFFNNLVINGWLAVTAGNNRDLVPLVNKGEHPIPTHRRFRPFIRFTRIRRQENFHDRERREALKVPDNFNTRSDAALIGGVTQWA